MVRIRLRILTVLVSLPFVFVVGTLFYLQIVVPGESDDHGLFAAATMRRVAPLRGQIYDRHGRLLAENRMVFDIYFVLDELHPRERYFAEFERTFSLCDEDLPPGRELVCSCDHIEVGLQENYGSEATLRRIEENPGSDTLGRWPLLENLRRDEIDRLPRRLMKALREDGHRFEKSGDGYVFRVSPGSAFRLELTLRRIGWRTGLSFETLRGRVQQAVDAIRGTTGGSARRRLNPFERDRIRKQGRLLVRDVRRELVADIKYYPELYRGMRVRSTTRRHYPLKEAASIVTGYLGALPDFEVQKLKAEGRLLDTRMRDRSRFYEEFLTLREYGRFQDERSGRRGLEAAYEEQLRGRYGLRLEVRDSKNSDRQLVDPIAPQRGRDIHTTLDAELQALVYRAIRELVEYGGIGSAASVAVLDLGTTGSTPGGVLAMACYPTFDSNRMHERVYLQELAAYPVELAVLLARPYRVALPPGSVFKLMVSIAALEDGRQFTPDAVLRDRLRPDERYRCRRVFDSKRFPGQFRCSSRIEHGRAGLPDPSLDLYDALMYSCNTYFYQLGRRRLRTEDLRRWASRFGYGRAVGIDLDIPVARTDERRGPAPKIGDLLQVKNRRTDLMHYAIGQRFVTATPMQILRSVAGIALDGRVPWPVLNPDRHREPELALPPGGGTLKAVREGMRRAVSEFGGTAHKESLPRYLVAAKTGTAEIGGRSEKSHGWMTGFAPVQRPEIAFVVSVEKTHLHGGEAAARVVEKILEYFARESPDRYRRPGAWSPSDPLREDAETGFEVRE